MINFLTDIIPGDLVTFQYGNGTQDCYLITENNVRKTAASPTGLYRSIIGLCLRSNKIIAVFGSMYVDSPISQQVRDVMIMRDGKQVYSFEKPRKTRKKPLPT